MNLNRRQSLALLSGIGASAVASSFAGCSKGGSGSSGGGDGKTLKILQYEDPNTAQGKGWKKALEIFKAKHPEVTVTYQQTSFDAMRQNAKITLTGNDVPDVVEFNKGNADGGQLAAQGLLSSLDEAVAKYGWDKKITGSMRSFAQYDEEGKAGDGSWYGIPNIGEYVMFFYNKDIFKKAGVSAEPTTLAELEAAMDKIKAAGVIPLSSSAASSQGFNQMWVWYSLVSAGGDRQAIDDFMFVRNKIDFNADPWKSGVDQFQTWIDRGYVGKQISGLNFEQATVNFLSGKAGMVLWNQGIFERVRNEAKFDWGYFTMPGANLVMGSSGHLWGVPEKAANKDLAYEWIETTLSPEVQNLIGSGGGLPIAGDTSTISDPVTKEFTTKFDELMRQDKLSFYPDYPVNGFLDFIQEHMQKMANGNEKAADYTEALQKFYDEGTAS